MAHNKKALLGAAKKEIEGYLDKRLETKSITTEIYEKAKDKTYKNLERWVTDKDIEKMSPNTAKGILDAIAMGRWQDVIEAFRQEISFGTAGIRGIAAFTEEELRLLAKDGPGAPILKGINSINDIVLLLKTAGVIKYARENGLHKIAIGYDSRVAGRQFAELIAESFIAHSTKKHPFIVYLFDEASPFPELSFGLTTKGVRADIGILISASHNPSNYNGYKITNYTGAQLSGDMRNAIVAAINSINISDIKLKPLDKARPGELIWLGGGKPIEGKDYKGVDLSKYFLDIHSLHVNQVKKFIIDRKVVKDFAGSVKIGYAAFNGSGNLACPRLLKELGFTGTKVITYLQELNGIFPAFGWGEQPDPGDPISADIAVREFIKEYGRKAFDELDILIGTDPDADRMGIIVKVPPAQEKQFGKYKLLSANDAWTLLLFYRLQREKELNGGILPDRDKKYITFSHVTTDALERMAAYFGVKSLGQMLDIKKQAAGKYLNGRRSWVGFTYIAEYAALAREKGLINVGGMEESNGFSILGGAVKKGEILAQDGHVNDKDGIFAAVLLAEAAAYAKSKGTTIFEMLDSIYSNPDIGYLATANKPMPRVGSFEGAEGVTKKINLLKKAQEWMAKANKAAGTERPFNIGGLRVTGAIEFRSGRYDVQHYAGFPDEGVRFFFEDPDIGPDEPLYNGLNYITIRPSGTSQTLRFYTQLRGSNMKAGNFVTVKHERYCRAETLALEAQIELLKACGYENDISAVEKQLGRLVSIEAAIWKQEPSIWDGFPHNAGKNQVVNWMGWLHAPEMFMPELPSIKEFVDKISYNNVVVLGTGGSGRAARTLSQVFKTDNLFVTYSPQGEEINGLLKTLCARGGLADTLFIVASKSGGTTETITQDAIFRGMLQKMKNAGKLNDEVRDHFVVITDEGTSLAKREDDFRAIFINNLQQDNKNGRDIGGRFSALSLFGLVPLAATKKVDVGAILGQAAAESKEIGSAVDSGRIGDVIGFNLGTILSGLNEKGFEYVIQIPEETTRPTGPWAEQLFNESLTKKENAPLWVYGEPLLEGPGWYGDNVIFIKISIGERDFIRVSTLNGRPLVEVTFRNFGELIFNMELAVSLWGHALGVNPFTQESVENSKKISKAIMEKLAAAKDAAEAQKVLLSSEKEGQFLENNEVVTREGIKFYFTGRTAQVIADGLKRSGKTIKKSGAKEIVNALMRSAGKKDYIGLFPYTNEDDNLRELFSRLRINIKRGLSNHPVTLFDFGPGFHHSNNVGITCKEGVTLLITFDSPDDAKLPVPGKNYTTDQLIRAMVVGELGSLQKGENRELGAEGIPVYRRVMRIHLPQDYRNDPGKLVNLFSMPVRR